MALESGCGRAYPLRRASTGRSGKDKKMAIKVGDKIPSVSLKYMDKDGMQTVKTDDLFKGKKVVLFALPGAFTPTCSAKHLPGFVQHAEAIKGKGVDQIVCLSVNDAFVMDAWGKAQNRSEVRRVGNVDNVCEESV